MTTNQSWSSYVDKTVAKAELKYAGDYLNWGMDSLELYKVNLGHGYDNAWDEVLSILLKVMRESWDADESVLQRELDQAQASVFMANMEKRCVHKVPAAYLNQEAWFAGMPFYIDERALIPRSPFAEILADQVELWLEDQKVQRVLDMCTGSACIAIVAAQRYPEAQVDAADISSEALEVATINVKRYDSSLGLRSRFKLIESDLFEALQGEYDLIISNPPYVDKEDMDALPEEFRQEPSLALAAGKDGLDIVVKMLKQANQYLSPGGILIVEVGNSEWALGERYPNIPFNWLEFEQGGHGVFMLSAKALKEAQQYLV